jgi:hypothetical protein
MGGHLLPSPARRAPPGNKAAEHGGCNTIPGLTCNIGVDQCHKLPNTVAHRAPCREPPSSPLAPRPGITATAPDMPRVSAPLPTRARRPGAKLPTAASKSSSASVTSSASSCWSSTICSDSPPPSAQPRQKGASSWVCLLGFVCLCCPLPRGKRLPWGERKPGITSGWLLPDRFGLAWRRRVRKKIGGRKGRQV